MSTMPYAYFNKRIQPLENATISIASNSLQYGTTCFGGIRGYHLEDEYRLFRLKDHHKRLMDSAKIMGMDYSIDYESFKEILEELVVKNAPDTNFYMRPFIFCPDLQLGPKPSGLHFELAIYMVPMIHYLNYDQGIRLMVSSWRKFSDASIPTKAKVGGSYVNSFLATGEAIRCGYDEALMMDLEGSIVESSVANIFLSHRNRVVSPPVGAALLEGITRRTVIELLEAKGIPVHFEKVDRSMIYTSDELLLTGTAAQICFAESVDGKSICSEPGPICKMLREEMTSVLAMEHVKSSEWVTQFHKYCATQAI